MKPSWKRHLHVSWGLWPAPAGPCFLVVSWLLPGRSARPEDVSPWMYELLKDVHERDPKRILMIYPPESFWEAEDVD